MPFKCKLYNCLSSLLIIPNWFNEKPPTIIKSKCLKIEIISDKLGNIRAKDNSQLEVNHTFLTASSVFFDAIFAAGGSKVSKNFIKDANYFINEAYAHYKAIGVINEGKEWLQEDNIINTPGVVIDDNKEDFVPKILDAISCHRHWNRNIC